MKERQSDSQSSLPAFVPIQKSLIAAQAIERIKGMVVRGELLPGQALPPERDLATRLGVSRPTLREAIRALTAMNILESRQGDGTFVTSLDPLLLSEPLNFMLRIDDSAILALFEVRRILEADAIALATERMTEEELMALQQLVGKAAATVDQPEVFLRYDFEIHSTIIRSTRNPILISLASSISQLSLESRRRTSRLPGVRAQAHADHEEIVKAIGLRDARAARTAMIKHLTAVETAFRAQSTGRPGVQADLSQEVFDESGG